MTKMDETGYFAVLIPAKKDSFVSFCLKTREKEKLKKRMLTQ